MYDYQTTAEFSGLPILNCECRRPFKQVQHSWRLISQESCRRWRSRPLYGKSPGQSQGCMNQWGPPQGRIQASSPIQTQISQWKWRNAAQRPPITKRTFRVQSELKWRMLRGNMDRLPNFLIQNWPTDNWCQRLTNYLQTQSMTRRHKYTSEHKSLHLISQRKSFLLSKVEILGVVVHNLRLWEAPGLST